MIAARPAELLEEAEPEAAEPLPEAVEAEPDLPAAALPDAVIVDATDLRLEIALEAIAVSLVSNFDRLVFSAPTAKLSTR